MPPSTLRNLMTGRIAPIENAPPFFSKAESTKAHQNSQLAMHPWLFREARTTPDGRSLLDSVVIAPYLEGLGKDLAFSGVVGWLCLLQRFLVEVADELLHHRPPRLRDLQFLPVELPCLGFGPRCSVEGESTTKINGS